MTRMQVRLLLDELGIKAKSCIHGFELPHGFRLTAGGGIACNGDKWRIVSKPGKYSSQGFGSRPKLRKLLLAWLAGDAPPERPGFTLYARRSRTRFGDGFVWCYRKTIAPVTGEKGTA